MKQLHVVGAGGIGGWVLTLFTKSPNLISELELHVWDKDKVEESNLDKQMFDKSNIGMFKVDALKKNIRGFKIVSHKDWFTFSSPVANDSILLGCADNHAARKAILDVADATNSLAIIGANETLEAEAYSYIPTWQNTPRDPRVFYPEILKPDKYDPTLTQRCTDAEALVYTPQLALANMMAASYMCWLLHTYLHEHPKNDSDIDLVTHRVNSNYAKIYCTK
jgi:molybdopterin/thiamine biosynthesis adenylyltransferase